MKTVTYHDLDGSAARIEWQGHRFLDGQPVEVNDPHVLAKAARNPFFEVSEGPEGEGEEQAQQTGRRRRQPKPEGEGEEA